jgi:uncharacterized protein
MKRTAAERKKPRGEILLARILETLLSPAFFARWTYRSGLQGSLRLTTHEILLKTASSMPGPLRIAFASDFHAGSVTYPELFRQLFSQIRLLAPDVLLLGGDYVGARAKSLDALIESGLGGYEPPMGTFAVLGNHDHWSDAASITRRLEAIGIEVLINRAKHLPPPFGNVCICGIDDPWCGTRDIAAAFKDAGSIRILLSHSPDGLLLLKDERFDVAFAGHTHGGQVTFPDGTPIITAGGPLARTYSRGRFEIPGNGTMLVSRGVGCSLLPVRINSDPELILCTLRTDAVA